MPPPPRCRPSAPPSRRLPRYDRARDLPLLLPLWPADLADRTAAGRTRVIALLRRALRQERARGLAGHWTYDLARHAQIRAALDAELAPGAEPIAPPPHGAPDSKKARY